MARRTWSRLRPSPSPPPPPPPPSSDPQAANIVAASRTAGTRKCFFIVRPFSVNILLVPVTTLVTCLCCRAAATCPPRSGPPHGDLAFEQLGEPHHRHAEEDEDQQHRVGLGAVERLAGDGDDVADPVRG